MALTTLATFYSEARGIKFYGASSVFVGQHLRCMLEPSNLFDSNAVALFLGGYTKLGHLAKEASLHLAPLMMSGFQASG